MKHISEYVNSVERELMIKTVFDRALNTWDQAPPWLFELCDALAQGAVSFQPRVLQEHQISNTPNTLRYIATDAEGKAVSYGSMTSFKAHDDLRVMLTALELVQAIKLRKVDITPMKLYELLVGHEYVAVFLNEAANPSEAFNRMIDGVRSEERERIRGAIQKDTLDQLATARMLIKGALNNLALQLEPK